MVQIYRFTFLISFFLTLPFLILAQKDLLYIKDVHLHIGDGSKIEKGILAFQNGKIIYAGPASGWSFPSNAREISHRATEVYPGFIAPNTILGLAEYEQVGATLDFKELGKNNANIRSIVAYNTESSIIPTVRSNGVLYAQIAPRGGFISGRSSVVRLEGHNWEDAVAASDKGMHVHWPVLQKKQGWWGDPKPDKPNHKYREQRAMILKYFKDATAWCSNPTLPNIKFQALCDLTKNGGKLFIHADRPYEIKDAILSLSFLDLPIVIVGGKEAWRIPDVLKKYRVAVIYIQAHSLPERLDDPVHRPYDVPAKLDSAGVSYCLAVNGFWQVRNLPFMAGQSVALGVNKEKAIYSITGSTAQILGMDGFTGQLKKGLSADFILSTGDALDMRSSNITQAYLRGKELDLNNKQKQLYRDYVKRYHLE